MGSLIAATFAASALLLLSARPADAQQPNPASEIRRQVTGSFRFVDPGSNHPITVWFCRTSTAAPDTRIVFPGDAYMFGNMTDGVGKLLPNSAWALTAIERLFDMVRDEMGLHRTEYDIVGFSGGAQFVHRLALFVPEARFRRAVAASAGRYAFPSWSEKFPYGLDGSPIDRMQLPQAFSRDLVVLLADRDITDREREPGSMAQGTTRFARGLRFFATATDEAAALGVPLRWQLRIVSGVDHSPVPMVRAALELLRQ